MPATVFRSAASLFVGILLAAGSAQAQVYKNTMPDGRIIYSDQPVKGASKSQPVDVPPPPTEADKTKATKRAQDDQRQKDDLQTRIEDRRKKFDDADTRVKIAREAVAAAQLALEQGRTPLQGEFIGMAGGGARPSERYFERVAALERGVESARKELDAALKGVDQAK